MRAAVEYVAHYVQTVHDQPLDDGCKRDDKCVCTADVCDRGDDMLVIGPLVLIVRGSVQQFVDDIFKVLWKRLPHFGARIFGSAQAAHLDHTVKRDTVPLVVRLAAQLLQLAVGIVDERTQLGALPCGQRFLE